MLSAAGELKYIGQLKRVLAGQFKAPDEDWVRFLTTRVYEGSFTQRVREQFVPLVEKATRQFLNEQVNDRLKNALGTPDMVLTVPSSVVAPAVEEPAAEVGGDVVTTEDELEGFRVVRAIVCSEVPTGRVVARDTKTYFGVLFDDNNRKPIARLWFNRTQKYLGVFDENKVETRIPIQSVEDIYTHAEVLRATVARYTGVV
ncbi:hypothetical protein [Actinokineospora bangkokensis]|uniref:hypothetical protein n=1 Tax=Actinokineospora bangkokensis TaxID=1193682 RepID=UPI000A863175|nr:hypothetical protein [Actinokineospora bangkokensis]